MAFETGSGRSQIAAPIVHNRAIGKDVFALRLEAPTIAEAAKPGQFLMIRVGETMDPLLRRPFSIHAVHTSTCVDVVFRVVGRGTALLSRAGVGENLDVVGPLGHGFTWQDKSPALLMAGGMGVAPLLFLAQHMIKRCLPDEVSLLIGARNLHEVLCADDFRDMGLAVSVATEDGSQGKKGLVTDLMTEEMMAQRPQVYSCGPYPMLRAVARLAVERGLSCQVSLENSMACGVGVCLGCVTQMRDGSMARVCQEGPVFCADEVAWT